jgi:alpha-1,6-mannosyltransferase
VRTPVRLAVLGLGLVSLAGYALDLRAIVDLEVNGMTWFVILFSLQFALYLAASWLVLTRAGPDRVVLALVLGIGLLFRLAVVPSPVWLSSDPYRYLWDGRVQLAGVNPYRYAPAASELAHLRDQSIHANINRPTKRTVYPPGAEMLFALVAAVAPSSLVGWRLFLLGCEIATCGLLLRLLDRMGRPPTGVILYAWAPLAVWEGVQAAHVEVAFLPALLLALLCRQEGRMTASGLALGSAMLIKLYPAVLCLAWWRRGDWRFPVACLATVAAGYVPYALPVGLGVLGFLPEYFSSGEDFNIGLRTLPTYALGLAGGDVAREVVRGIVMLLLFGLLTFVLMRIRRALREGPDGVFAATLAAVGAYLLLVPTAVHAWYVLWIVPLLAVRPMLGWLWFSGAIALSYLDYAWRPAPFPAWAWALEFLPLWGLLAWEWQPAVGMALTAPTLPSAVAQPARAAVPPAEASGSRCS